MGGWMGGKARLRIAYSNQKLIEFGGPSLIRFGFLPSSIRKCWKAITTREIFMQGVGYYTAFAVVNQV